MAIVTLYADYSAARLTGAALRGAGFGGAIRYAGTPGRTKNTTPGEVTSLKAAGLAVHGVFENATGDFTGGASAGAANARLLLADATACGITGVLFMSADQHLTAAQLPVWQQYLRGAATVLGGRLGAYGFSEAIIAAKAVAVPYFWQCGSHSTLVAGAHVWQRNTGGTTVSGIAVDINDVLIPLTEVTDVNLSDTMPTAVLDDDGNYASDGPAASVEDILRFADASVRWLVEKWVPLTNAKLAALEAGEGVALSDAQLTSLLSTVGAAVSSAVGVLNVSVSTADQKAIADAVAAELAARLSA